MLMQASLCLDAMVVGGRMIPVVVIAYEVKSWKAYGYQRQVERSFH